MSVDIDQVIHAFLESQERYLSEQEMQKSLWFILIALYILDWII